MSESPSQLSRLDKVHDRLGSMIDQIGQPDYSLRELVDGLREVRDELFTIARSESAAPVTPSHGGTDWKARAEYYLEQLERQRADFIAQSATAALNEKTWIKEAVNLLQYAGSTHPPEWMEKRAALLAQLHRRNDG
jgi:hypothetical protein